MPEFLLPLFMSNARLSQGVGSDFGFVPQTTRAPLEAVTADSFSPCL